MEMLKVVIFMIVGIGVFVIYTVDYDDFDVGKRPQRSASLNKVSNLSNEATDGFDVTDKCDLPHWDPWDKEVAELMDIEYNRLPECENMTFDSSLISGKIVVRNTTWKCQGRCLTFTSEYNNKASAWTPIENEKFDCDIVEVNCTSAGKVVHNMVHLQIVELPKFKNATPKPNVYVFLLDSVGPTLMIRSMPRTLEFFEKSMKAVSFPYLNKIGLNSLPNAVGLWFGLRAEDVDRSIYNMPKLDVQTKDRNYLNIKSNKNFLFNIFEDAGYRTMFGEDWKEQTIFLNSQRSQHYLRPLITALFINKTLRTKPGLEKCAEIHRSLFEYMKLYLNSYRDQPKFSWLWFNELAHNNDNGLVHADGDFHRFLLQNREQLDDAFVIIMADHGPRFGKTSEQTKLGQYEKNNPMFSISVPKHLRETTDMLDILRINAKSLQTHYDVRATLIDIAKHQFAASFSDRSPKDIEENGSSLLREQPTPRTCKTLPIPLQYCLCQPPTVKVASNSSVAKQLGAALVDHVNQILSKKNLSSLCETHVFAETVSLIAFVPEEKTGLYSVTAKAGEPSTAVFKAIVHRINDNMANVTSTGIDRLDRYGNFGNCAGSMKHLCHCKLSSTTKPALSKGS